MRHAGRRGIPSITGTSVALASSDGLGQMISGGKSRVESMKRPECPAESVRLSKKDRDIFPLDYLAELAAIHCYRIQARIIDGADGSQEKLFKSRTLRY